MKFLKLFMVSSIVFYSFATSAQENGLGTISEGVQSFQQGQDSWRRGGDTKPVVIQTIIDSVTKAGMNNVTEAEQVFCYEVATKPMDYAGYTLNNTAITGFCGILNTELKDMIVKQFFGNEENIDFVTSEKCVIRPRLMLRFVRGVDYTDVLLSSPCHSFSVFYAGKVKTYNFRPGAEIIDTMIGSFANTRIDFTSPALLNQLLPVGVVQNEQQKKAVEKQSSPVRSWESEAPTNAEPAEKKGGWGNLKL